MAKSERKKWAFASRFRRNAFGWRSQPAVARVKQAVSEIKKTVRRDPVLAAKGAVLFFEKVSPALAQVDSSSGAIGTAVNHAIRELVPIIAKAPADEKTRDAWLERLWEAHKADEMPYIELLADHWGELCASKEVASIWADRLLGITRMALSPDKDLRGHFHGTSACLSALFFAGRYTEIIDILDKTANEILSDLIASTPGDEGKWFAAAKGAGLYDEAIGLALRTPCDPRTLTRAARDFAEKDPAFAIEAGLAALHWLVQGYGYEITSADVWAAYANTLKAAEKNGTADSTRERVRRLVETETFGERFVTRILGPELGLRS